MNSRFNFLLIVTIFCSNTVASSGEKIFKDLNSTKYYSFKEIVADKTLSVLFQPNCSACKKQIKNLDCLSNLTKETILVGSLSNEKKVKRSYLKKKTELKAYFVETNKLNDIGFENFLAPQVIFYSAKKNIKFLGYKSCEKIKEKIQEVLNNDEA